MNISVSKSSRAITSLFFHQNKCCELCGFSAMESFDERCTPLKEQYDACFNSWYSDKFLRGDTSEDGCAQLFKVYRECLAVRKLIEFTVCVSFSAAFVY